MKHESSGKCGLKMRSIASVVLLTFVSVVFIVGMAQAGIKESVTSAAGNALGWVIANAALTIIGTVFTLLGALLGKVWGARALKAKIPAQRFADVLVELHNAKKPTSPGGKETTPEERENIDAHIKALGAAILEAVGVTPPPEIAGAAVDAYYKQ